MIHWNDDTRDRVRDVSVVLWIALWIYLSLGMVLISFSAIQFQTQISDEARRDSGLAVDRQAVNRDFTLKVTVAQIELSRTHYQEDLKLLPELIKQADAAEKAGNSDVGRRIGEATRSLYPDLFSTSDPVPSDVVD